MSLFDGKAVISGIGQSDTGRKTGRTGMDHTIEGCLRAISDAGVQPRDIDGLASYPGPIAGEAGFVGATTVDVHDTLGIRTSWFMAGVEGGGPDRTDHRGVHGGRDRPRHPRAVLPISVGVDGAARRRRAAALTSYLKRANTHLEFHAPFGAPSAANWVALYADRYMHDFGLTREQLAQIALNARNNAARNPRGIYKDPLTLDDYLSTASSPIPVPVRL